MPTRAKLSFVPVVLFLLGVLLTILGFLVDNAVRYQWVLERVAPDYASARDAFEILDSGENAVVPPRHPGAAALLARWPTKPYLDLWPLSGIGRSTGVLSFPDATTFYELKLLTAGDTKKLTGQKWRDYVHAEETWHTESMVWRSDAAKAQMEDELEGIIGCWRTGLLVTGIILSAAGFAWERWGPNR